MSHYRSNYALVEFGELLADREGALDVPWATFAGDESTEQTFEVPVDGAVDGYVTVQALDVDAYGHEILVNGDPLSGFDIPPASGWQSWMDVMTGATLHEGENTIQVRRDTDSRDAFVVGTVRVNWREPVA
ncbi:DUF7383 domain-containing protein [Halomarina oriensis]|uniref:Carbohydrate-binding protein n=1 Tax=Halomarina oriensis TaxID=671145 RepID=A0A6B0GQD8_9EURY|nr:hypothetical protein [Halomarina oriensis]MWG34883.1 hypothetical protein [Halomarina oriensis]